MAGYRGRKRGASRTATVGTPYKSMEPSTGSRESQKVIEQGHGKNSFVSVLLSFSVCHKMGLDSLT